MDTDQLVRLLIAGGLVLLNAFFVAAEFALVKVRATQLEELIEEGSRAAVVARHLVRHLNEYLSACQIGITMASLALGWVGEPALAAPLRQAFARLGPWSAAASHAVAAPVAFALITFIHITFGEQAPKGVGIQRPVGTALWVAYPLHLFHLVLYPAIWLLAGTTSLTLRLMGLPPQASETSTISQEELNVILAASHRSGLLKASELNLVRNVFRFADRTVSEIMVPRVDMVCLSTDQSFEESLRIARESGFTRLPAIEDGNLDNVLGYVHIKDLLLLAGRTDADIRHIIRPVKMIPETKPVERLLREFQQDRAQIAIVLDEYGGTSGLVTLEDVVEELVGEIWDEFDSARSPRIRRTEAGQYVVDAATPLADLEAELGLRLPPTEFDTAGGFVQGSVGTVPRVGDTVQMGNYDARVIGMRGRRIRTLLLVPRVPQDQQEEP